MVGYIYIFINHTTFNLQRTRTQNTQFTVNVSNTPVILKQSQGHQTYDKNVDPEQGYNHTQFERPRFNGVREKGNVKVVVQVVVFIQTCAKKKN